MSESTVGDRIKERRKALGMSQLELARQAGLKQPTISSLELNQAANTRNIASIAHALHVNALWLQTGVGDPKESLSGKVTSPSVEVMKADDGPERYRIEVVESRGSCGGGDPAKQRDVDEIIRTMRPVTEDAEFFRELGIEPSDVKAVIADGDGMANFIVHGDVVLVSTSNCDRLLPGQIYAFTTPAGILLKRVIPRSSGRVILSSDNPDKHRYPDEEYTAEEAEKLEVFGRYLRRTG